MLQLIIETSKISPLISGIVTLLLGIYVGLTNLRHRQNLIFLGFCSLLSFWAFGCYIQSNTQSVETALLADKLIYSVAVLFPFSLIAVVQSFTLENFKKHLKISALIGGLLFISNWFFNFRTGVHLTFGARFVTTPDLFWYVYLVFFSCITFLMFWELIKKRNYGYLLGALVILITAGISYFSLILIQINPLVDSLLNLSSSVLLGIFILMTGYLILKHTIFDTSFVIRKTTATVIMLGVHSTLFLLIALPILTYSTSRVLLIFSVLWAGFVGITFETCRDHLQTVSDKLLFKKQIESEAIAKTTAALNYEINAALSTLHLASQKLERSQTLRDSDKTVVRLIGDSVTKIGNSIEKIQKGT